MTEVFGDYAKWYDAFNRDKNYAGEADYLVRLVGRWIASPRTWLDLGCGSGIHLSHLAARGIAVEGVDASEPMIRLARQQAPGVVFHVGDLQRLHLSSVRDVISMLFHVMSYQTTDAGIRDALRGVASHLHPQGVFVFDFWHTDAVVLDPPASRARRVQIDGRTLFRISHPAEDRAKRRIDVHFEFRWDAPDGPLAHEETHAMRHFTAQELEDFLDRAGLKVLACEGWMRGRPLTKEDWYGVICAAKR